jgi:Flp pilus assembly protein TadD
MDLPTALSLHQSGRRTEAAAAYQAILAREPDNPDALHAFGVLRHQAGDSEEAAALIARAIALRPYAAEFHFNLGLALFRLRRFDEAAAAFAQATRHKPDWPVPHYDLGNALHAAGRPEEAARAYRAALKLQPDYAQAEVNLANVLKATGKRAQAIAAYRRVLRRHPELPELHNNLGAALLDEGDRPAAEAAFREAIRLRPDFAEALGNLAALLIHDERFAEAVPIAETARAATPTRAGFCEMHGDALRGATKYQAAVDAYSAALAIDPAHTSARFGMAEALRLKRDLFAAEALLRDLVAEFPKAWQAHHDLANVRRHAGRFAEAEAGYRTAATLRENAATLSPLGMVLRDLNRLDEATVVLQKAYALEPANEDVRYNLATTHLTAGRLAEGFALYDSRNEKFKPTKLPGRAWTGGPLRGRTLLVAAEQGLGDTLQFIRYLPALADTGARILLRAHRPLLRLLEGFPGPAALLPNDDKLPPFDFHVRLMSLPHLLRRADPCPLPVPYLAADPGLTEAWRDRLDALPGLKVGLVWSGNPGFAADNLRSIPPTLLAPLAAVQGVTFISLQKGATEPPKLPIHDWTDELNDFADTASLMSALDLVLTVDTAAVHLAGALGRPVWLLNRFDTCWRWLTGREDSIWYPTVRIFRQPAPGDWQSVVQHAAAALAKRAAA